MREVVVIAAALWTAITLTLGIAAWLGRSDLQVRRAAAAVVLLALGPALALAWVGPDGLPLGAMLVLREGNEEVVQRAIWERDPWFGPLVHAAIPLRATTLIRLLEAVAAWSVAAVWLTRRVDLPTAAAVLTLVGGSAWAVNSLGAEEPIYAVMAVTLTAVWLADRAGARGGWLRLATVGALAAWCVALTAYRWEVAALPAACAASLIVPVPTARAWRRRLLTVVLLWMLTSALFHASDRVLPSLGLSTSLRFAAGPLLGPRDLGSLRLPIDLFTLGSPGLALLVLLGMWTALGRRGVWPWLVAATVLLARTYALASHVGGAPLETLRYGANLLGPICLFAAIGAAELKKRAGGAGEALLIGLVSMALFPAAYRGIGPWGEAGLPTGLGARVDTTQQAGARFVVDLADRLPGCTFVTALVSGLDGPQGPTGATFDLARYGVAIAPGSPHVDAWARDIAAQTTGCVVFVAGLDCNLPGARCAVWTDGAPTLITTELHPVEHNTHHGTHPDGLQLGAWALGDRSATLPPR